MSGRWNSYVALIFRFLIGGVFVYAALPKIADPYSFAVTIRNYQLVFPEVTNLIAIALPWLELYAGLFLIAGIYLRESSLILGILTVVFILALSQALMRGLDIGCGCFSPSDESDKISLVKIAEDILLLLMIAHVGFTKKHVCRVKKLRTGTTHSAG